VQVVQIRGEPEPLNGAFDVLIDMLRRVGDASAATIEDLESTLGGNFYDVLVMLILPKLQQRLSVTHGKPCRERCAS
jgi:hypothetical protein